MRKLIVICMFLFVVSVSCEVGESPQDKFWDNLVQHCGKSYEGKFDADNVPDDFKGKTLKMYVMECSTNQIKIPFYVGEDHSRTWVYTRTAKGIELKHDHRLENGTPEEITMYGGTTSNTGLEHIQFFRQIKRHLS